MGRDLLFETSESQVYRIFGSRRRNSVIVKITHATRVEQQLRAQAVLNGFGFLSIPPVRFSHVCCDRGLIVFNDEGLQQVDWTSSLCLDAVRILARLHREVRTVEYPFGASHTPPLEQIVKDVQSEPLERWIDRLARAGLPIGDQGKVSELWQSAAGLVDRAQTVPLVWSHGDAHYGNFMWNLKTRRLSLIDWEYAHLDLPFFDLYQMLDATSPLQPLIHPADRETVLRSYWSAVELGVECADFAALYRGFALWHHLWILVRIEHDERTNRFPGEALIRQRQETIQGIIGLLSE